MTPNYSVLWKLLHACTVQKLHPRADSAHVRRPKRLWDRPETREFQRYATCAVAQNIPAKVTILNLPDIYKRLKHLARMSKEFQ
jgi:hypothetical protein